MVVRRPIRCGTGKRKGTRKPKQQSGRRRKCSVVQIPGQGEMDEGVQEMEIEEDLQEEEEKGTLVSRIQSKNEHN